MVSRGTKFKRKSTGFLFYRLLKGNIGTTADVIYRKKLQTSWFQQLHQMETWVDQCPQMFAVSQSWQTSKHPHLNGSHCFILQDVHSDPFLSPAAPPWCRFDGSGTIKGITGCCSSRASLRLVSNIKTSNSVVLGAGCSLESIKNIFDLHCLWVVSENRKKKTAW